MLSHPSVITASQTWQGQTVLSSSDLPSPTLRSKLHCESWTLDRLLRALAPARKALRISKDTWLFQSTVPSSECKRDSAAVSALREPLLKRGWPFLWFSLLTSFQTDTCQMSCQGYNESSRLSEACAIIHVRCSADAPRSSVSLWQSLSSSLNWCGWVWSAPSLPSSHLTLHSLPYVTWAPGHILGHGSCWLCYLECFSPWSPHDWITSSLQVLSVCHPLTRPFLATACAIAILSSSLSLPCFTSLLSICH